MANSVDPYQGFNFLVEIEGILAGGFSDCSGLQAETDFAEYREGGRNDFAHHFAGATKYPPLVLKRGLTRSDALWAWHQDVAQGRIVRRNGTLYLLDRGRSEVMSWQFTGALPVKWTGPDLQAHSIAVAVESVTLIHRGLSRQAPAAQAGAGAPADASSGVAGSFF